MRPLHIGLLVVGAALAGGLAVKMTELQPLPVAASVPVAPSQVSHQAAAAQQVVPQEVGPQTPKPTPMPDLPVSAPPPAYTEPAPAKTATRINKPKYSPVQVARIQEPEVRTFPPLQPDEPNTQPAPVTPTPPSPAPPLPAAAMPPRQVTLRSGSLIAIRVEESLSSDRNAGGDTFSASLTNPLVADGLVIAERGARVTGRVINAQRGGPVSGTSLIELGLAEVITSDGQHVAISTEPWSRRGDTSRVELGAIIGAGAGTVVATRGKPVNVPSETLLRFRLAAPVTITERR